MTIDLEKLEDLADDLATNGRPNDARMIRDMVRGYELLLKVAGIQDQDAEREDLQ